MNKAYIIVFAGLAAALGVISTIFALTSIKLQSLVLETESFEKVMEENRELREENLRLKNINVYTQEFTVMQRVTPNGQIKVQIT